MRSRKEGSVEGIQLRRRRKYRTGRCKEEKTESNPIRQVSICYGPPQHFCSPNSSNSSVVLGSVIVHQSGLPETAAVAMRLFTAASTLCALFLPFSPVYADAPSSSRLALPQDFKPPQVFKNTNLVRNTNLEKGYVRETVNVVVENVDKKPQSDYYLSFPSDVYGKIGGLEVRDKKAPEKGRFDVDATIVSSR